MPVRQNHSATELSTTGTVAIQLRSTVLREIWGLAAQTPVDADNAANDRPSVEQVENAIEVCAHGLSDLLATPGIEAERCRRGCLQCATTLVRAFARTASAAQDSSSAAALLRSVDARLTSDENSVLSGEKTYELDLDAVRDISTAAETSEVALDSGDGPPAWDALEKASVEVILCAARAIANLDRDGIGAPPPVHVPAAVLNKLRMIAEELACEARGLPQESMPRTDRVGVLLSKGLRMGLPAQAAESLRNPGEPTQCVADALGDMRSLWVEIGAAEYEIVRTLDCELAGPTYAGFGSLQKAVIEMAANVLAGGPLADRPGEFLMIEALFHQHDGLARSVEFYAAGLRGDADALRQAQLVVLTRLARVAVALWVIDARLEALYGCSSA